MLGNYEHNTKEVVLDVPVVNYVMKIYHIQSKRNNLDINGE